TARGAGPSVSDGGDHRVAVARQPVEHRVLGDAAGARLLHDHDLPQPVPGAELLPHQLEEPIAVDLAVVQQPQHLAVEIGDALGDGDAGALLGAHGRIENLDGHRISLVTASEFRSRLQDGMKAEWPPAPPPATTM